MSVREFKVDIEKLAKKLDVSVGNVVAKTAAEALNKLVERTPRKTGRAQASWAIKIGSSSDYVPPAGEYPPPPKAVVKEDFDGPESVFITSSLDYIKYLEEGTSTQAAVGMVAISLAELEVEAEFIIANN